MMKPINLLELFVFITFLVSSIAMSPKLCGCISLSTMTEVDRYRLKSFIQCHLSNRKIHNNSLEIVVTSYENTNNFDYEVIESDAEHIFKNNCSNTDIVFLFNDMVKIYAKNNVKFFYNLHFTNANEANIFANRIISATPELYEKCEGSHSYNIEKLYERLDIGVLNEREENWCIFKKTTRKADVTTFVIRSIAETEESRNTEIVFRSTDYSLTPVPDANNKYELIITWETGGILNPSYILETSTPDQMRAFFTEA